MHNTGSSRWSPTGVVTLVTVSIPNSSALELIMFMFNLSGSLSSCTMGTDATGVDEATDATGDVTKDDAVSDCSLTFGSTELFLLLRYLNLYAEPKFL